MRTLIRNKRTIYVCKRYQDDRIAKYEKPIKIKVNYHVTNSDGDLIALGLDYPNYIRIKADLADKDTFEENARVYIKNKPTENSLPLCKDADYEINTEPVVSLNSIEVTLKKLSGK